MIKGIENINTFITINGLERWSLKSSPDKDNFLFTCEFDEPMAEKKKRFETILSTLSAGRYYLEGLAQKSTRGTFREMVYILPGDTVDPESSGASDAATPMPTVSGYPSDYRERLEEGIELARVKMELERKNEKIAECEAYIKDLEAEIEKSEVDSPMNRIMRTMEPFVPAIAQRFLGGTPTDSPKLSIEGVPDPDSSDAELDAILCRVSEIFGTDNPVEYLRRLLSVLNDNPTYIPIIKNLIGNGD